MPTQCQTRKTPFPHLYIRASGQLRPAEYFHALKAVMQEDAFRPHFPTLLELSPDVEFPVTEMDLQEAEAAGGFIKEVWGSAERHVAIAGGSPDTRSLAAMIQNILNENPVCRTFGTVAEARQWLSAQAEAPGVSPGS